jgi:hypothetical protein
MATPRLVPVFSGVEAGVDGNTNAAKLQPELQVEDVHPYMSLYYPILIPSIGSHDEIFPPKSIRTSSLQKRPVVYATRIYVVDVDVGAGSRASASSVNNVAAKSRTEITAEEKFSPPALVASSISGGTNKQTVVPLPSRGTEDERSKLWNKTKLIKNKNDKEKEQRRQSKRSRSSSERPPNSTWPTIPSLSKRTQENITPDASIKHVEKMRHSPRRVAKKTRPRTTSDAKKPDDNNAGDQNSDAIISKKRKRKKPIAISEPVNKRSTSSSLTSDESSSNSGNVEIDGNRDGKKPAAPATPACSPYSKRQRNSPQLKAALDAKKRNTKDTKKVGNVEEKSLELVALFSRRYPRRKHTSSTSPVCDDDMEEQSDGESINDSDRDDDGDDEFNCQKNCDDVNVVDEKLSKIRERRKKYIVKKPQDIYPNGRYPGVDYDQLAKECNNEDYIKDVKTDNGKCRDQSWNKRFRQLLAHYREHGNLNIKYERKGHSLSLWLQMQRNVFKIKQMHPARFKRLQSLGFKWKIRDGPTWMESFQKLVAFKKKHGHPDVPKRCAEDPHLGLWVRHNRAIYNHKRYQFRKERIDCLESIGFNWVAKQIVWTRRYKELSDFNKKHKHFRVPLDHPNGLARWVQLRREEYARKKLHEEPIDKLNKIGFDWKLETKRTIQK